MNDQRSFSQQRRADNELMFKDANIQVARSQTMFNDPDDVEREVQFYCECANRDCTERISMSVSQYEAIHQAQYDFIIIPTHEEQDIEDILTKHDEYWVVRKHQNVRKPAL